MVSSHERNRYKVVTTDELDSVVLCLGLKPMTESQSVNDMPFIVLSLRRFKGLETHQGDHQ